MKNKLNVFAAVFLAGLCGAELALGAPFAAATSFLLALVNLYVAGFFEDSK